MSGEKNTGNLLVDVRDLNVEFDGRAGIVRAVDGLDLEIRSGQTMGVIGESGCGKSVTARVIMQMVPKPGKVKGEVLYYRKVKKDGKSEAIDLVNITKLNPDGEVIRQIRGGEI